jgi:hypothetical protein
MTTLSAPRSGLAIKLAKSYNVGVATISRLVA